MPRYDAIIVGGGSAGCLLANRLTTGVTSAGKRHRVLLLEAGTVRKNFWVTLPVGYYKCNMNPVWHTLPLVEDNIVSSLMFASLGHVKVNGYLAPTGILLGLTRAVSPLAACRRWTGALRASQCRALACAA